MRQNSGSEKAVEFFDLGDSIDVTFLSPILVSGDVVSMDLYGLDYLSKLSMLVGV